MAKRLKDMGDWRLVSDEPAERVSNPGTPTRRTRRGTAETPGATLRLVRESDGTSLSRGDCILVSGEPKKVPIDGDSYYAVVVDVSSSINTYVEVVVAPLVRPLEGGEEDESGEEGDGEGVIGKGGIEKEGNEKGEDEMGEDENGEDENGEDKEDGDEKVKRTQESTTLVEQGARHTEAQNTGDRGGNGTANATAAGKEYIAGKDKISGPQHIARSGPAAGSGATGNPGTGVGIDTPNIDTPGIDTPGIDTPGDNTPGAATLVSALPQLAASELLVAAEVGAVRLHDIVEKVQVLSAAQFGDMAPEAAEQNSVFMCRRATDRHVERVSAAFDFGAWRGLLARSPADAVQFLAEKTLVIVSPSKKRVPAKAPGSAAKPRARPVRRLYVVSSSDSDSLSSGSASSGSEDSGAELDGSASPAARRKRQRAQRTPRQRHTDAVQRVASVLLPHRRGFKVKAGTAPSSLPSLPSLGGQPGPGAQHDGADGAGRAFRELREKLHTLTRLALLPCREDQFAYVYTALEAAVQAEQGMCLYLSGQPGVGKTATVRETIGALHDSARQGYVREFDYCELNCLALLSPGAAYERLYEQVSGIKVTPANARLLLQEHFAQASADSTRRPLVVLVDELDQLVARGQDVLYNLFNWPTFAHSRLVVVAVANTMDLPERALSNKTASRLGLHRYAFKGYSEAELGVIIAHRLALLSEANKRTVAISPDAMRFACKKVALVSGDARRALAICRRAVEIAELDYLAATDTAHVPAAQQAYSVRISHIGRAIAETVNSPVAQVLASLPFAAKVFLATVLLCMRRSGRGDVPLGDVMDDMRHALALLTTSGSTHALRALAEDASYVSLFYGDGHGGAPHVRLRHVAHIVSDLADQGIIEQQNVASERLRAISLKVSESEIVPVISRDLDIAAML
ncbi:P-loop containing nucleoside triphosphate hydrolase protein [Metschnikowia bicuspidata var. bicuspidata NRRL YB-4993]|uniref:Origin recognition complex subunit 1 n=1 Tax=Metschnikowia bicuspidata var. bicuspidata NRRL YB-4993 TaxID=869754 RepID=A0A1A0HDG1_9ASCO|nr:P-loop containing nucleoside triphosphate hydrolase protein [Metschnikowia bicuspidata var. bicuspidata NRRL YB-4993]OBA22119.1 P-loop containing nucleoside triphosphate hydrolase protein [Metschnikowia bicuspidata var. bicuspidata NRRL YB-4993]